MNSGHRVGNYELEERIGEGGTGEVWRAKHLRLGHNVAIKIVFPNLARDRKFQTRFLREAQAMATLAHPHIVTVLDFLSADETAYLVMSYIGGGSLENAIAERKPLPTQEIVQISREVLSALHFAHQNKVVHRDVKPSNILISENGHTYLADFGIALMMGKTRVTKAGAALGTPEYMSPEQIKGLDSIDRRTDIYSYGCVLYEMLSGHPPFGAVSETTTDFEIMSAHVNRSPPSLETWSAEPNEALERVVIKALSKKPGDRFDDCEQMTRALSSTSEELASHGDPAVHTPVQPATPVSSVCAQCGAAARPTSRYCSRCGTALSSRSRDKCAQCEAPFRPGARFCNRCGHTLPQQQI